MVSEIRIRTALEHRLLYVAKFAEGVYVLHVFEKRTRKTPPREIEVAKHRLRDVMEWRSGRQIGRQKKGGLTVTKVIRSSGNVFQDLGFPPDEAEHLRIRSDLMTALLTVIADRKLTQARAAALFGVSQPRVSDLVRGKIDRFSIETLVEMLGRVGVAVDVVLRPAGASRRHRAPLTFRPARRRKSPRAGT